MLGCRFVISIGGFKKEVVKGIPSLYTAATDASTLKEAVGIGAKVMVGHIFGIAGILIGLNRLRSMKGFALLVDTVGTFPDAKATNVALTALSKYLQLTIDLANVDDATSKTKKMLEPFGLIRAIQEEKKKEDQALRWYI